MGCEGDMVIMRVSGGWLSWGMYAVAVVGLRCRIRSDGKKEGEWIWWINRGRDRAGTSEM